MVVACRGNGTNGEILVTKVVEAIDEVAWVDENTDADWSAVSVTIIPLSTVSI